MTRLRFDRFEADLTSGELWKDGVPVRIQELPFRVLVALLGRPGDVVTRAELGARLWPDGTFVDVDAGLNTAVAKLREALDDRANATRLIETIPKRGYRLTCVVRDAASAAVSTPVSTDPVAGQSPLPPLKGPRGGWSRAAGLVALAAAVVAMVGLVWWTRPLPTRVAVVSFDNETDRPELDRLAQTLTDSVVLALGNDPRLAVIGNAAVLRTPRPFRDLQIIREALQAELIVIGQLQTRDDGVRVLAHLIRSSDQAHVWVNATPLMRGEELRAEAAVVDGIRSAVAAARSGLSRSASPSAPDQDRRSSAPDPSRRP